MFCFFVRILGVFYQIYFVQHRNGIRMQWNFRNGLEIWKLVGLLELDFRYIYQFFVFVLSGLGHTLFNEYNFSVLVKKRKR
jgi:hypothetical protein